MSGTGPPGGGDTGDSGDTGLAVPALLRFAWGAYAEAVRARLAAAGIDDLPRHGSYVLGGMARHGFAAADVIGALGISKQRASQVIEALVSAGYLARRDHPGDRRRVAVELTPRGAAAAEEIRAAVAGIDERLAAVVAPEDLAALRRGLAVLAGLRTTGGEGLG